MKNNKNLCLTDGLCEYSNKKKSIFSMPGHKGNFELLKKALFLSHDVTETPDTDCLFYSEGIIANSEKKASEFFGTYQTIFSAQGSTSCIQTMISLIAKPGEKIICARNCHISVINTCALLDIEIVWVYPEYNDALFISGNINPLDIENALIQNRDAKGVFITSPDYFGIISNLEKISKICKKFNCFFAVDNAHGAHLSLFDEKLHPMKCGVDICCDSAHKTLPALTGAAFLHINNKNLLKDAKQKMSMFSSSSPSYLIMSSLDVATDYLISDAKNDYFHLAERVSKIKNHLETLGYSVVKQNCDPVRLGVSFANINNIDLYGILEKHNVESEYCSSNLAIFIPSPFNSDLDFKRLENALIEFSDLNYGFSKIGLTPQKKYGKNYGGERVTSIRKAMFSEYETLNVCDCEEKVAAYPVFLCPPGVTPVIPGEKITKSSINILKEYGVSAIKVIKYN